MSIVAIVPVAQMAAANAALELAGFGPRNFSVPAYGATGATHAALHAWEDAPLRAALKTLPNVIVDDGTRPEGQPPASTDPITRTRELIEAQGAKWGAQAPALPTTGNVTAGGLYRFEDALWSVIQTFSRTTYGAHPSTYPALIRKLRDPYKTEAWRQPIDQYDSYKLVNAFTGAADTTMYASKTWRTKVDNNVWEPAAGSLWDEIDAQGNVVVPPANEYPQWVQPTGGHDAYAIGASAGGKVFEYVTTAESPTAYPAGWQAG